MYNDLGDKMIYIDLLLILNFFYDFILLLTLGLTLKRDIKLKRIIFSSLFGSLTVLLLFLNINNILLLILEIIMGIFMTIFAYKPLCKKEILENIIYLYMLSVILAGFLYYLNLKINYSNYILLLIISPIILFVYYYQNKKLKKVVNYERQVKIVFKNNRELNLKGFIDTGNRIRDPVTKKYVILINPKVLEGIYNIRSPMYVSVSTVNKKSLIECISIKYIEVDGHILDNYLLGFSSNIKECLLNYNLLEDIK